MNDVTYYPLFLKRCGITPRQWKARKRSELKDVLSALEAFEYGIIYCPVDVDALMDAEDLFDQMTQQLSSKAWK
jgi:hypothetical protein